MVIWLNAAAASSTHLAGRNREVLRRSSGGAALCLRRARGALVGAMTEGPGHAIPPGRLSKHGWWGLFGQVLWGSYPPMAKRALMEVPQFSLLLRATAAFTGVELWLMRREE